MRWALNPISIRFPQRCWQIRRYSSNLYEKLSLSLGVKSEQEERLVSLLARDPADLKNTRRLQQQIQLMASSSSNLLDLMKKFSHEHKGFAGPIYSAVFHEMITRRSPMLQTGYKELIAILGPPPPETLYVIFTTALFESPQSYLPVVLKLFEEIPTYLLASFSNVWLPKWLELHAPAEAIDAFLLVAARRGLIPYTTSGYAALAVSLQRPLQIAEYVKSVTKYLAEQQQNQRVPQLRQGFCTVIARKLRTLPAHMHPDIILAAFIKEVQRLKPPKGRAPVLGSRFWLAAQKIKGLEIHGDTLERHTPKTIDQCREEIEVLTAKWKAGNPEHDTPLLVSQLYSLLLARYTIYEPSSLHAIYKQADNTCNRLFGSQKAGSRRRQWLTSILATFVHENEFQKALPYVPQVLQVRTPYLWGLAIVVLAKSGHTDQAWEWAEKAITQHRMELPHKIGVTLLESSMTDRNTDIKAKLEQLYSYGFVLTDKQLGKVLQYAGTGSCQYRWSDLRKLLITFSDFLVQHNERLREQSGIGHWRRPHTVLSSSALQEVVRWGFIKRPAMPWCSIELIKELRAHNVAIDSAVVHDAVGKALKELQASDGESSRIRNQCPHNSLVISEQFAKAMDGL